MMMRENEKSMRTLAMLRYQADRYQSVGWFNVPASKC